MNRSVIDLWVGVFVAIGIASLMFLALKVSNSATANLGDTYRLSAEFANIGGLKIRAPVKSAGVVVGRVADIRFDKDLYKAVVDIDVSKNFQFPKDTFANIYTSGLLGEQYLGLEPGGDSEYIKPGEAIRHTQDAVVLEKLISQFLFNKAAEGGVQGAPAGK